MSALADLDNAPAAVKLFVQYCVDNYQRENNNNSGSNDDNSSTPSEADATTTSTSTPPSQPTAKAGEWIGRTKVFVRCDNLTELKLPKFLHTYNAKPALIRESGSLIR